MCGSVGPLSLGEQSRLAFERLGDALAVGFGLRGLFGVDAVVRDGVPYPVEINPRYTASVEVLEHALGVPALALHAAACGLAPGNSLAPAPRKRGEGSRIVAKAILFARASLAMPATGPWSHVFDQPPTELRPFADLSPAGRRIATGQPILTVFTRADSVAACVDALRQRARDLDRCLYRR